jgi:hypothetical protein
VRCYCLLGTHSFRTEGLRIGPALTILEVEHPQPKLPIKLTPIFVFISSSQSVCVCVCVCVCFLSWPQIPMVYLFSLNYPRKEENLIGSVLHHLPLFVFGHPSDGYLWVKCPIVCGRVSRFLGHQCIGTG